MITIIISGPQGIGKTRIAQMFKATLEKSGFVSFKIFTTNSAVRMPPDATLEE